jgi:Big-like domain-containing protein
MSRTSLITMSIPLLLGACARGAATDFPESNYQRTSARITDVASSAACKGTSSKSVDGKLRRVRIEVDPCRLSSTETAHLVLANIGQTTVGFDPSFKLEKRTPTGWRWINRRQAFPLPLAYLQPRQRSDPQAVKVNFGSPTPVPLDPGVYRVTKGIDLTPGEARPPTMPISARFRVIAGS